MPADDLDCEGDAVEEGLTVEEGLDQSIAHRQGEQGFGLIGIRERLSVVGGHLQINSADGHGTYLVISIPLEK